jgi:hypothetical protein
MLLLRVALLAAPQPGAPPPLAAAARALWHRRAAAPPPCSASAAPARGAGYAAASRWPRRPRVAVALSGGVDSAVAALLVRRAGLDAFGVYMHNWDASDEAGSGGGGACTSERDLRDAAAVARALGMPLLEADFVGRYWGDVFSGLLAGVAAGLTPNPDLACNAAIKFGALWEFAAAAGADALATGHYARVGRRRRAPAGGEAGGGGGVEALPHLDTWAWAEAGRSRGGGASQGEQPGGDGGGGGGGGPLLLRGADPSKDQSYFLASVAGGQLAHAMFPVGGWLAPMRGVCVPGWVCVCLGGWVCAWVGACAPGWGGGCLGGCRKGTEGGMRCGAPDLTGGGRPWKAVGVGA